MPFSPWPKPYSPSLQLAVAILVAGLAMGMTGHVGQWLDRKSSSAPRVGVNTPVDRITVPGNPNPLRWLSVLTTQPAPPLEVPSPSIPQPLPPQAVWPAIPSQQPRPSFSDIDSGIWVAPILEDLAQRHLIKGFPDGTFRPNDPMTRAEFATQISLLFALAPRLASSSVETEYGDVAPNHWAINHIQSAIAMGFLTGYPDQTFRPEDEITRLQVLLALAKGLNLKSSSSPDQVLQAYPDANQVPSWAKSSLITALEANLMVNYPDPHYLEPNRAASRAEVMAMLRQTLVYTGHLSPLSPSAVPLPDQPTY